MPRIRKARIYTLTNRDADRIRALLLSVEEAISTLIEWRSFTPLDVEEDWPGEASVYRQTSQILADCEPPLEDYF